MPTAVIDLADETSRWRYRCPRGHTCWTPSGDHLFCRECGAQSGSGTFEELHDKKSNERLTRAEVRIVERGGPRNRAGGRGS